MVEIKNTNGRQISGTIQAIGKGGWYTVDLEESEGVIKARASQLWKPQEKPQGKPQEKPQETTAAAPNNPQKEEEAFIVLEDGQQMNVNDLPLEEPTQAIPSMTIQIDPPLQQRQSSSDAPAAAATNTIMDPSSLEFPPPPKMEDLDALLREAKASSSSTDASSNKKDEFLQQIAHFQTVQQWVVFTDLHCAPSTIDTSLQILQRVHQVAAQRTNTGVLFLGDFWHHRGTLRVDCLNAVLQELRTWQVPMMMIPGNHDQITLSGHAHGLTPLEYAYRVSTTTAPAGGNNNQPQDNLESSASSVTSLISLTVPGLLVFSHPTVFHGALFVPHIRDIATLESVLQSPLALDQAKALFVHADVTGAYMNDMIVSTGGVHPSVFPAGRPIYSGHFHKPHTVTHNKKISIKGDNNNNNGDADADNKVAIEYLGSPYETSLAEAHQRKALAVLDASQGWKCVERIPMDIGRKHYKPNSMQDLLAISLLVSEDGGTESGSTAAATFVVREGDRVVVTLPRREMIELEESQTAQDHIRQLRKGGVTVEVREANDDNLVNGNGGNLAAALQDATALEDLSPTSTWKRFWEEQTHRGVVVEDQAKLLQQAGLKILEELDESNRNNDSSTFKSNGSSLLTTPTHLQLDSVTVEGYGPFAERIHYPLKDRGLVLLRGSNRDGGSDR